MTVHVADPAEPPLGDQFVARMAAIWARHGQDPDDLAGAMLSWAVNQNLESAEPRDVAALLVGIAAQLCPPETAGHA